MATGISIDDKAFKLSLKKLIKEAPEAVNTALVKTAIEARSAAQEHIRAFSHIVTSRLINSIYIKTKGVKVPDNSVNYKWDGGSGSRNFGAVVIEGEAAIGTNVVYAEKIMKIDDFMQHAINVAEAVFPKYVEQEVNKLT